MIIDWWSVNKKVAFASYKKTTRKRRKGQGKSEETKDVGNFSNGKKGGRRAPGTDQELTERDKQKTGGKKNYIYFLKICRERGGALIWQLFVVLHRALLLSKETKREEANQKSREIIGSNHQSILRARVLCFWKRRKKNYEVRKEGRDNGRKEGRFFCFAPPSWTLVAPLTPEDSPLPSSSNKNCHEDSRRSGISRSILSLSFLFFFFPFFFIPFFFLLSDKRRRKYTTTSTGLSTFPSLSIISRNSFFFFFMYSPAYVTQLSTVIIDL